MKLSKEDMDMWADGMRKAPDEKARHRIIFSFEFQHPDIDSSWLEEIQPTKGDFRSQMISIEMKAKRERAELYKKSLASGEITRKPRVTQTDVDSVIGTVIDAPPDISGIDILKGYSYKADKPTGWLDAAKSLAKPKMVRKSLSKHKTKDMMQQLKVHKLLMPYNTDLTNQRLMQAINGIQRKKVVMTILINHELRLQEHERQIEELQSVVSAFRTLEATPETVSLLKSRGFNNTQIAKQIGKSVSTVKRLTAQLQDM